MGEERPRGDLLSTAYRDVEHHSQIEESLKKVEDLRARGKTTSCFRVALLMQCFHSCNSPSINEAQDGAPTSAEAHANRLSGSQDTQGCRRRRYTKAGVPIPLSRGAV